MSNLNPRQFMYHHSAAGNRASIKKHGLIPGNPYDTSYHQSRDEAPEGVYLALDRDTTHTNYGHDLWRVNTEGLHLHDDPDDPNHEFGFKYSSVGIPANRVRLAKKAVK